MNLYNPTEAAKALAAEESRKAKEEKAIASEKARVEAVAESNIDWYHKEHKTLKEAVDGLPFLDQLFLSWVGSLQQQCNDQTDPRKILPPFQALCKKMNTVFPDMTGFASYLSKKTDFITVKETPEDFAEHYAVLQRTRLYRLFITSIGALIAAGLGVKYAVRKWTEYIEKRKGTPSQRKLETQVLKQPSAAQHLLNVKPPASNHKKKKPSRKH